MADRAAIQEEIKKQGEVVRKLKAEKAAQEKVDYYANLTKSHSPEAETSCICQV
jgi:hypothetical protein